MRNVAAWRGSVIPLALILAWEAASQLDLVDRRLLLPMGRALATPFFDPDGRALWLALGASLLRLLAGAAIGVGLGAGLGLVMGLSRIGERLAAPSFTALRQVTLFAWIPLLTAWFGHGDGAKLVFIALSAFFPMALNTQQGLRDVPLAYRELANVLLLPSRLRLWRVLLPAAVPAMAIGVEIALINAWIGTVGAEYAMGFGRGVGIYLAEGREQFRMDMVLVGVVALALTGYAINQLFRFALRCCAACLIANR